MFTKVLVADRGEIAVRAFGAAYELGAGTLHRLKADESDQIGDIGHSVQQVEGGDLLVVLG